MPYAELLARTNFSLLEGASHPEEVVEAAARVGASHLGVADRDGVYGLVRAHKAAREHGVSLVCGATLTVVGRPPLVLLAETLGGWGNLCRLLTEARANAEKGRAEVGVERVAARAEGLSCVLRHGWAPEQADILRGAFAGRLAVALVRRMEPGDRARTHGADALAGALGVPVIASSDPLLHAPERQQLADVLTCIRRRTTLGEAGYALSANAERTLLSEEDFLHRFADRPEAVRAALEVAERCRFSLDELKYQYPHEVVPEGWTPMIWLGELVRRGLSWRYPEGTPDKVQSMVDHELRVIEELNFPAYFLTVYDIVRFARSCGILCQGRGSAANSAVCYALGVTSVDPARSTLLFERFISKERGEPPDIDVDFEHERREEVIQYIYERYGRDRAALVNEVISYRRRSAIRDVGKVFGLSLDQVDRLAKSTDRWAAGDLALEEELIREAGLDPSDRAVQLTMETSDALASFPRHLSQHVGGFTITETPLIELVPVEKAAMENRTVIHWDKYDIDVLQFVKVDVLALGMLTCIRKCFDLIEGFSGKRWSLATIPPEDPAVYDMFCRADTVGVFQIESRAQMSMLPRLKPRCFYDLVIEVAIVRPGPIQGGMVHPYLRRRNGDEPVTYAHPALKPILERTLGVPLFQEQVMAMAVAVGGFTPGQADRLRRAMGAWRKRGRLDVIGRRLVKGMVERGIPLDYAEAIFKQILGFGEYGFPESHAASFSLLVYVSGWLKRHHPATFAAGLINSQPMGFYSPRAIVADAQRHGVEARPVCVQQSDWDCTLERSTCDEAVLRLGLRLVQGFGEEDARRVEQARAEAPFCDLADFTRRTGLDRGKLQALADADAFRSFGLDRRRAVWELQGLWTGLPLFAGLRRREPEPALPEETPMDGLRADYRATGLSVAHHPVEFFREGLRKRGALEIRELARLPTNRRVSIGGLVSNRQRPGTANGVVFMTLEDETGMANLVVWPRTWAAQRKLARNTSLLGADGRLQRQGDAVSVLVERFWPIEPEPTLEVKARNFH
jgi:error-prone DNA polymerase